MIHMYAIFVGYYQYFSKGIFENGYSQRMQNKYSVSRKYYESIQSVKTPIFFLWLCYGVWNGEIDLRDIQILMS